MNTALWVTVGILISASALAGEAPAVQKVMVSQEVGCGAPPPPGHVPNCPTVTRIRFEASTIGLCDEWKAESAPRREGGTEVTIVKTTLSDCTRPQHDADVEALDVTLGEVEGPISLSNPLLVQTFYRP